MGNGSYIGGSTVVRIHPRKGKRPRTVGLLALEAQYEKTGEIAPQSLLPAPPSKPTKRKAKAQGKAPASPKQKAAPAPKTPATAFKASEAGAYLRRHHSACPSAAIRRVVRLAEQGRWTGMSMEEVVASCMEHYLTYEACGLERLIDCGLERDAALRHIAPQVRAVMVLWGAQPVWAK